MTPKLSVVLCLVLICAATTLGSAMVFLFKRNCSEKLNHITMGLASGIMLSVSVFGLILPAMDEPGETFKNLSWLPVTAGFLIGCIFIWILDIAVPHMHLAKEEFTEGPKAEKMNKNIKFFLAVTMHNIPEGIATGLAVSQAVIHADDPVFMWSAISMAVAIAIQNLPEGAAVSIPLFETGVGKGKSFLLGFLSGIVEPIFGVLAFLFATTIGTSFMPWLLAFAGGAMIYVTVEELIPDIKSDDNSHLGIWAFIVGFMLMMLMETLLG